MNTIKRYLLSVLFLCVSLSAFSQASVYPIDLSAVMLPPYTNCLGDYFSNGRVQLKAIVKDMSRYGKDATLEYSISVKVKRGNTVVLSSIAPLKRKFSETQIINDIPVKELFSDRNNYTGTASGSFFGNGYCLEEGSYEFEYQLFDKNKGNMPLSEPFSVYCYLTQAEPPVGVFPEDGKCYDPSEIPQTMLFQWIDPIAIGPQTRSYELHIKEDGTDMAFTGNMFPKQEAPSSMELYNQSVFNNNFVLINNSASKFREGHKYYWYVQMRGGAADGTNNNAYKNGGKSQTYSFSIGNCNQEEPKTEFDDTKAKNSIKSKVRIELDSAKVVGGAVKTMWELKSNKNDELICGFKVYCYKVDGGNSDEASEVLSKTLICGKYKAGDTWTEKLNSSVFEEGVEYFCFVRPVLQNGELGLMSNELSFKIESAKATASPSDDDDCIVELTPRSCVGDSLLTSVPKFFFANDAHQVISVDVNETKMEGQTFTGSGIVTPAWLKNIVPDILPLAGLNVEFEKIKINTDGYLCEGEIKVVSDPDNNLYFDLNELVDFNAGATVASKQKEVFTKEVEKEEDIKGDEYKGEVVRVKSTGDLFAVSMADGELQKAKVGTCLDKNDYCPVQYRGALNSKGISLRFDVDTTFNKDTYSPYIDKNANPFTAQNILDGYVSSGSDYIQPWISMVQGEYKWIKAYFEGTPDVDPNNVEFYLLSKNSLALLEKEYVSDDNYFKVKIYGGQPSKSLQIVARSNAKKTDCSKKDDSSDADSNASDDNSTNASSNADSSDGGDSDKEDDSKGSGDKKCEECGDDCVTYGSAQIYMLSSKKVKVMLVPVVQSATDNNLNIDDLKAKVTAANEIINKRFAPLGREFELVVDDAYEYADIPDEGFNVSEDNSEWTKETDEMKALRKAYGLKVGKRDEYQACLFLLTQAKKDGLQGYMPRSNSVGFIFLGNNFENVQSDIMAHELCHGLYGLQHTFAYPGAEQGALHENLMDYVDHNDERYLSKYFQWNNMERFNGHVFKLLDDVEDGELNCVAKAGIKTAISKVVELCIADETKRNNITFGSFTWDAILDFGKQLADDCISNDYDKAKVGIKFLCDVIKCASSSDKTKKQCVCEGAMDGATYFVRDFLIGGSVKQYLENADAETRKNIVYRIISSINEYNVFISESSKTDVMNSAATSIVTNTITAGVESKYIGKDYAIPVALVTAMIFGETAPLKEALCYTPLSYYSQEDNSQEESSQNEGSQNENAGSGSNVVKKCSPVLTQEVRNTHHLPNDANISNNKITFTTYNGKMRYLNFTYNSSNCVISDVDQIPDYVTIKENGQTYIYIGGAKTEISKIQNNTVLEDGLFYADNQVKEIDQVFGATKIWNFYCGVCKSWMESIYSKNARSSVSQTKQLLTSIDLVKQWNLSTNFGEQYTNLFGNDGLTYLETIILSGIQQQAGKELKDVLKFIITEVSNRLAFSPSDFALSKSEQSDPYLKQSGLCALTPFMTANKCNLITETEEKITKLVNENIAKLEKNPFVKDNPLYSLLTVNIGLTGNHYSNCLSELLIKIFYNNKNYRDPNQDYMQTSFFLYFSILDASEDLKRYSTTYPYMLMNYE